jgi:CO/xanthine dehydrogenase FAD-binding subunit
MTFRDGASVARPRLTSIFQAASVDDGIDPPTDLNATAEYRQRLACVLRERALRQAAG